MKISFSIRQIILGGIKYASIILILIIIAFFCFKYGSKGIDFKNRYKVAVIIFFFLGLIFYPIFKAGSKKLESTLDNIELEINNFLRGKEGEKIIYEELKKILLEKDFKVFRNFVIPGTNFDIDIIVVGQKGLIIFEVKNYSKELILTETEVFLLDNENEKMIPLKKEKDPREHLKWRSSALKKYLDSLGYSNISIRKAVFSPRKYSMHVEGKTDVFVVNGKDYLKTFMDKAYDDPIFTPEFINKLAIVFENK